MKLTVEEFIELNPGKNHIRFALYDISGEKGEFYKGNLKDLPNEYRNLLVCRWKIEITECMEILPYIYTLC